MTRCTDPDCDGKRIYDKVNKRRWKCSSCDRTHEDELIEIQSTSFFEDRKTQLTDSRNDIEPEGIPFIKEVIQNADDRKATEVCIIFSEKSIYISNNGKTFNYKAEYEEINGLLKPIKGDLCNICSVKGGNKADEDDTVGRHGTGFELVYCIGNQFEMHWWQDEYEENWSRRSNPEKLESPAAEIVSTWDKPKDSDLINLESPYCSNDNEGMRGVLFKVDWRKEKGNKKFSSRLESIFSQDVFTQWNKESRAQFFDDCINYGPLMIQFCKSILELKLFWLDDKESKTVEIIREKAYPTDEYRMTTHYVTAPKYKTEIVDISVNSYSFQTKSIIDNINLIESKDLVKIINLEKKKILNQNQWKLFHGWSPIFGTEYTKNRGHIDTGELLSSWKIKKGKEIYHICSSSARCYGGCAREGEKEKWREDRTPIVHIHIPINDISDDLEKLDHKGKTLLNSILPLAVTSNNRFMISADFYVQQTRRLVEHNETTTAWNICAAKTSFWLHSKMLREISEEVVEPSEIFLLQSTMAKPDEWFSSMGIAPDKWPDEELFFGEEESEEDYFDYTKEKWLIDRDNRLVGLEEIIIPTDKNQIYDEKLAEILQKLDLSVMTKKTHEYLFGDEAYLFRKLREKLTVKQKIWSSNFNGELKKIILENLKKIDLTGYNVEEYLSLIEIVIEFDKETDVEIFPDVNGKLRNLKYFKKVPKIFSNLSLIVAENREIHPKINWIEVGELKILDEKYGNRVFTERNKEVENLIKISSQLIKSNKLDDTHRISYNYIPCKRGKKIFLRPDNFVNVCECGKNYVATFLDDVFNCRDENCQGNIDGRSIVDWDRLEKLDRSAIYGKTNPKTKSLEIIENKIMFSLVENHGREFTNSQIIRYMARKNSSNQESLFDDWELSNWLQDEDDMKLHETKKIFLNWIKEYLLETNSSTDGQSMGQASANVIYDSDNNWSRGSEFILYSDEQLMKVINTKDKKFLIPHPELIEDSRDRNNWMEHPYIGVKKNIEWLHIEKKIKELLEAAFLPLEEKNVQLANLAIYLMKNEEIIPSEEQSFWGKEWIPLGKQIGFEENYVTWGKFPAPINSEWVEVTKRWRNQNTWNNRHISEYEYFKEDHINWLIESINSNKNFADDIGIRNSHDANRLFLALIESSQNYNASKDKSEPLSESYYRFLSQKLEEIPKEYLDKNYSLKFYDKNEKKWLYLGLLSSGVSNERPLLVSAKEYSYLKRLNEDITSCINIEKLGKETTNFLEKLGCEKSENNPEKMIQLLSRYCDIYSDNDDFEVVGVARILKKHWKNLFNMDKTFYNFSQDVRLYTVYNNRPLNLSQIIIVKDENKLNDYEKNSNLIYNLSKMAKDLSYDNEEELLRIISDKNRALDWDGLRTRGRLRLSEEKLEMIKKIPKEIFGQEIMYENAVEWCKIIGDIYWDFYSEIIAPIPYWDGEELKIEVPKINSDICLLEEISPKDPRIERFRKKGLTVVFSDTESNRFNLDVEKYNSKANDENKFRIIKESMIISKLKEIKENDLSPSLDVEKYFKDIFQALSHKMNLENKDNDNPLKFIEKIRVTKTDVALSNTLKLLDFEIEGKSEKPWIINTNGEEGAIWPEMECTYNPKYFSSYNNKNKFLTEVIKMGLDIRLGTDNDGDYKGQKETARNYLEIALNMENNLKINYEILTILRGLLEEEDPRKWPQIENFEGLKGIKSIGPLVLNPNERESINQLKNWYSEDGCQICGRLTPDGPGSNDSQESRKKIWGKKGGLSKPGSFDDRSVGTWLYLCPSHSKLLERHCVKLHFWLKGENEPLDSDKIVERFKQQEVVNLDHISDTAISVSVYERKEKNKLDLELGDESDNSPKWSDTKKIEIVDEEHRKKIVLKFREYVSSKIGNR